MRDTSLCHRAPEQTDPGIYVGNMNTLDRYTETVRHRQWSINLTLGGSCCWRGSSGDIWVTVGDLLITRPDTPMTWQVPKGGPAWHIVYAVCSPSARCESWLNAHEYDGGIAKLRLEGDILARVRHGMLALHRLYSQGMVHRDEWALLGLERVILTLHTHLANSKGVLDPRVSEAVLFIHKNLARRLTCADIARAVHLSASHLSFLFSRHLGEAPMQYLERLRCERAAEMLRFTSNPIREIAAATGFLNAAYFCNRFRHYSGQAPGEYRKLSQGGRG